MITVKFGDKDSYKDWGLILKPKKRPFPAPKTKEVSIEGRDGTLDLTTSLTGDVKYQNVSYTLEFTLMDKRENWEDKLYEISTYLHGKKMNVIFSDDSEWYCVGRVSLNELTSNKSLGVIRIDCDFEPYKLKVSETVINEPIEAGKVITLSNSRKWVMPTFEVYSKNLFNLYNIYPAGHQTTINGITYTINDDGSITANGTATENAFFYLYDTGKEISLKKGTYRYSFFTENGEGAINTFRGCYIKDDGSQFWINSIEPFELYEDKILTLYIVILKGTTINNVKFFPQLEKGTEITEYEKHIENTYANFVFEGKEFAMSGTLKTPDIILKEGGSQITLNSGIGNIEITYKEGKL